VAHERDGLDRRRRVKLILSSLACFDFISATTIMIYKTTVRGPTISRASHGN
jgi:hypothetical protein